MTTIKKLHDLADKLNTVKIPAVSGNDLAPCPFSDYIGIEVEVENMNGAISLPNWTPVADGSLRNNGMEFISAPCSADTIHNAIYTLFNLGLSKKQHSFSPRTSIHVHVNMRDEELNTVQYILRYYALFEVLLYRFVSRARAKNLYCVPLYNTTLLQNTINNPARWNKYTGLNCAPLAQHGTLEFRHMHGTHDTVKIMNWICLILSIVNYVKGKSDTAMDEELIGAYEQHKFLDLLDKVFGKYGYLLRYKTPDDIESCYMNVVASLENMAAIRMPERGSKYYERMQ